MGNRMVLALVAVVAVAAVGGMGFAAYTSAVTVYGGGSSGDISLAFDYGSTAGGTNAVCTITDLIGNTVHVTATDLSPGDSCSATLGIINNGSLPATSETSAISSVSGNECNYPDAYNCIQVTDNLASPLNTELNSGGSGTTAIGAGDLYPGNYVVTISEPSGTTQSVSLSFDITFTGSEGS
jgi:hypothetical protein